MEKCIILHLQQKLELVGTRVAQRTIANRLLQIQVRARCVPNHRHQRLQFRCFMFSDETCFGLGASMLIRCKCLEPSCQCGPLRNPTLVRHFCLIFTSPLAFSRQGQYPDRVIFQIHEYYEINNVLHLFIGFNCNMKLCI